MARRPYALKALGMINALGREKAEIKGHLLAGEAPHMERQAGWIRDREIVVGAVPTELPPLPAPTEQASSGAPTSPPEPWRSLDSRNSRLLYHAYMQIEAEVQACIKRYGAHRVGVVIGSSTSGIAEGERAWLHYRAEGQFPPDFAYRQQELGSASAVVAAVSGAQGPTYTVSTACTSSTRAFGSARNLLALGLCDAVIVGGGDSLCRLTLQGFGALGAVSSGHCNPMSRHRDGINIGEGAALFVLTHSDDPRDICLWGVGESSDAHHISAPAPDGSGALRAMSGALDDAGLQPKDIGYVNLHGTATKLNDAMESKAIYALFGREVPCSSSKPLVGHTLGAAGATEVGLCWLLYHDAYDAPDATQAGDPALPPHRWDGAQDEELDEIQLVAQGTRWRRHDAPYCMSNSFAFGGNNCVIVIGPREPDHE